MCNLWAALLHQPPIVGWYILAFNLLAAAFIIFFEKREPEKTIAWLVVLFALPGLGFLAYLLLGRDWRKRKFRKKRVHDRSQADVSPGRLNYEGCVRNGLRPEQQQLLRMGDSGGCLSTSCDNQVQVFTSGQQKFAALLEAIRSARHHIHLEYFIWQRDDIGREVERVLAEKAQEGIEVRLLLDGFGCWRIGRRDLAEWQAQGIQATFFFPVSKASLLHVNYRDHRKIVVIDGRVGFVGGFNVGDNYLGKGRLGPWRDTHLRLEGTAVHDLQSVFLDDWEFATGHSLTGQDYFPAPHGPGRQVIQITLSGPDSDWASIRFTYFRMIASATRSVRLTTPYFIPDTSLTTALQTAALGGVDVKIITPGVPDHPPIIWAGRTFMRPLLRAGVQFFEYQDGFVHAKVLTVDDDIASVGTANFDMRSLELNFEVNALLLGQEITTLLNRQFEEDLTHCRRVELEEFLHRPILTRMKESAARLASPLF